MLLVTIRFYRYVFRYDRDSVCFCTISHSWYCRCPTIFPSQQVSFSKSGSASLRVTFSDGNFVVHTRSTMLQPCNFHVYHTHFCFIVMQASILSLLPPSISLLCSSGASGTILLRSFVTWVSSHVITNRPLVLVKARFFNLVLVEDC